MVEPFDPSTSEAEVGSMSVAVSFAAKRIMPKEVVGVLGADNDQ